MKKIIIIGLILLLSISSVIAFENLENGEYLITSQEFQKLSNTIIAKYMSNSFQINNAQIDDNVIYIYYDIISIEPQKEDFYIKKINYKTTLNWDLFQECYNDHTMTFCIDALIHGKEKYYSPYINEENQKQDILINSTKEQAYSFAVQKYYEAINLKNNLINEQLKNDVINNIT